MSKAAHWSGRPIMQKGMSRDNGQIQFNKKLRVTSFEFRGKTRNPYPVTRNSQPVTLKYEASKTYRIRCH